MFGCAARVRPIGEVTCYDIMVDYVTGEQANLQ
jgi:hypothetical protein